MRFFTYGRTYVLDPLAGPVQREAHRSDVFGRELAFVADSLLSIAEDRFNLLANIDELNEEEVTPDLFPHCLPARPVAAVLVGVFGAHADPSSFRRACACLSTRSVYCSPASSSFSTLR